MRSPRVLRARRDVAVVASAGLLAAGAIIAVVSLHDQADQSRQAQIALATVATAAQQVASVPLVALYENVPLGRQTLARANRAMAVQLAKLQRSDSIPALAGVRASTSRFSRDIGNILTLVSVVARPGTQHVASLPAPGLVPGLGSIQRRFQHEYARITASD